MTDGSHFAFHHNFIKIFLLPPSLPSFPSFLPSSEGPLTLGHITIQEERVLTKVPQKVASNVNTMSVELAKVPNHFEHIHILILIIQPPFH